MHSRWHATLAPFNPCSCCGALNMGQSPSPLFLVVPRLSSLGDDICHHHHLLVDCHPLSLRPDPVHVAVRCLHSQSCAPACQRGRELTMMASPGCGRASCGFRDGSCHLFPCIARVSVETMGVLVGGGVMRSGTCWLE